MILFTLSVADIPFLLDIPWKFVLLTFEKTRFFQPSSGAERIPMVISKSGIVDTRKCSLNPRTVGWKPTKLAVEPEEGMV